MSTEKYCTGTFVGQRLFDDSLNLDQTEENQLKLTLCFTPTKHYPSVFGACFIQSSSSSSSIIHGTYNGTNGEAKMKEMINGIETYEYQSKLSIDRSNRKCYLYGSWKSLIDSNLFGKLALVCIEDDPSECLSGIWIGQSNPADELKEFYIPVNPIRWCATLFRTQDNHWQLFGSGYFNDSADIPNEPLLFFTLNGSGTLDNMNMIKKYTKTDYLVEYRGKFVRNDDQTCQFVGQWSNSLSGSYGSFLAKQRQLNPFESYRVDICICEVCRKSIDPGENRWCCFDCHFSTCHGCHLNSIALDHPHPFVIDILPNQKTAHGKTSKEFVENALEIFHSSPFLFYRNDKSNDFLSITYGQMAIECEKLRKYWKRFVGNAIDDDHRPMIVLIANTSPAYICCLLTGILCQSVLVPINGSLNIDAMKEIFSKINPSLIVIGEGYVEKVSSIFSSEQKQCAMIIYENEEQFDRRISKDNEDIISFTQALQLGERNFIDLHSSSDLSKKTISAILFTSGSTGCPKGAIFSEELILPNGIATLISPYVRIDYQSFDPVLLLSIISTMQYGCSRALTNLNDMWKDIKIIKPTNLGLTPSLWNVIYKNYLTIEK